MKKILFTIILLLPLNVFAYENDIYSIDLNTDNIINENDNNIVFYQDDNYISINIIKNTNEKIEYYTEEDINKYKKYVNNLLEDNNTNFEFEYKITSIEKTIINNYYTIKYSITWDTEEIYDYDLYTTSYAFTSDNYIYNISITGKEINNNIINTFNIKDTITKDKLLDNNTNKLILLLLIIGVIVYVLIIKVKSAKKN